MIQQNEAVDEILEFVWTGRETGPVKREDLYETGIPAVTSETIERLFQDDLISEDDGQIDLTERGERHAEALVRAHRLAERLFTDVLELRKESIEQTACSLEHCLSQEAVEAICTLLGHPRECPHGRQIPRGECCERAEKTIDPVVVPLSDLRSGQVGRIVYVSTKHHTRLDRLTDLGVTPGEKVKVHQTLPAFVINVRETDIAIDTDVLKDVYVKRSG